MEHHNEVGLIGCQYNRIDEDGNYLGKGFRSRWCSGTFFPRKLKDVEYQTPFETFFSATGQGPFALFRKSVFNLSEKYDERLWSHEDSDIFCQMALLTEVHYIPEYLYYKREHTQNLTQTGKNTQNIFRDKWDNYKSDDFERMEEVLKAKQYYYRRHVPFRDFKVAKKAFIQGLKKGFTQDRFNWIMKLLKSGIGGIFLGEKHYQKQEK